MQFARGGKPDHRSKGKGAMNRRRISVAFAVLTTLAVALPFAAPQHVHAAMPTLTISVRLQAQTLPRVPIDTMFTIHPRTAGGFVPIDAVVVVHDERPTHGTAMAPSR